MQSPPPLVNLLGSAILQRLTRHPMSGYDLKKLFTSPLGYGWRAWDTQIYRELKVLEQRGLIAGETQEGRAGPQRRVFCLTSAGRAALAQWLESPLDEFGPKSELTMRIWSVDLIPPAGLYELLRTIRTQVRAHLDHMQQAHTRIREAYGPPETMQDPQNVGRLLALENNIETNQVQLRWLDRVEAVVKVREMLERTPTETEAKPTMNEAGVGNAPRAAPHAGRKKAPVTQLSPSPRAAQRRSS